MDMSMSVCLFEYGSGDMDSGAIDPSYLILDLG